MVKETVDRYRSVVENQTELIHRVRADGTFLYPQGRLKEIGRDIGDLKQAEQALLTSQERLNLALSASRMGVWERDVQTNAIYWSPECFEIIANDNFTGTLESFTSVIHRDDVAFVRATAEKALVEGTDFLAEFRIVRPDGEVRWLCDRGRPSYDADGIPLRLAGTVQDITDRKRSEENLNRLHEKMSDLSAHLETVREQERLAISREIHDEIGQTLTALKLDLSWVNHRIAGNGELAERLAEMRSGLDSLIATAQHITAQLRPPLLDELGIVAAIEWQLRQFRRRSGIDCRFVPPQHMEALDGKVATAVMRILVEALNNTLRHAQATRIEISLCCCPTAGLELEMHDDGRGITREEIGSATSFGIMGMQERARLCHGELAIYGRPGKGSTVCLTIPLRTERPAAQEDR